MRKLFEQYAGYNVWANQQLLSYIMHIDEPLWYKETPSSFNSIYKTIMHVWGAEAAWLVRLRKHEMFELLNPPTLQATQKMGFNSMETDCKKSRGRLAGGKSAMGNINSQRTSYR